MAKPFYNSDTWLAKKKRRRAPVPNAAMVAYRCLSPSLPPNPNPPDLEFLKNLEKSG
jgi:hypothetical protein